MNRAPSRSLDGATPYEVWTGVKPNIEHFRVFGSLCHVKGLGEKVKKLQDRSKPMVFIGYEVGTKGYKCYDPEIGRVYISRDVIFEEKSQWNWKNSNMEKKEGTFYSPNFFDTDEEKIDQEAPLDDYHEDVRSLNGIPDNGQGGHQIREESSPRKFANFDRIYEATKQVSIDPESCYLTQEEPSSYNEASKENVWRQAMEEELDSIEKIETLEMVTPPPGCKPIRLKWVYKIKRNSHGDIVRYKARLVAKGYVQKFGIDYEEVFAPVAKMETIRVLLALAAQEGWQFHHMDVKSAFLNGELEEEVYVKQPDGYIKKGREHLVMRLKKALYGLKQAPRAWYTKLDNCLRSFDFTRSSQEHAVYFKRSGTSRLIIGVYVDDLIITGTKNHQIEDFKAQMKNLFEMSDLGLLISYLGIEVTQERGKILLSQKSYALRILEQSGMSECNPAHTPLESQCKFGKESHPRVNPTTYRSLMGSLRYLTHKRPDLMYFVGYLSRYMENLTTEHVSRIEDLAVCKRHIRPRFGL